MGPGSGALRTQCLTPAVYHTVRRGCAPVGYVHQQRQNIRGAESVSVPRDQGMHPQHSRTANRPV